MNIYNIEWSYVLSSWINYTLPQFSKCGTEKIKAKSESDALNKFADMGYYGQSSGKNGYYRVEKISKIGSINIYI